MIHEHKQKKVIEKIIGENHLFEFDRRQTQQKVY